MVAGIKVKVTSSVPSHIPLARTLFLSTLSARLGTRSSHQQICRGLGQEEGSTSSSSSLSFLQRCKVSLKSCYLLSLLVALFVQMLPSSIFLTPLPNHLGKYPGEQLLAHPSKCHAHPLSQVEEMLLKAAGEGSAPVSVKDRRREELSACGSLAPFTSSFLGSGGGEGKSVWWASFR